MKTDTVLGNNSASLILRFLSRYPDKEFYVRDIARNANISVGSASEVLGMLEVTSILVSRIAGNMKYFRLNVDNPLVLQLKRTLNLMSEGLNEFVDKAKKLGAQKIILFGSYARGENLSDSDIDILVVSDTAPTKFMDLAMHINEKHDIKLAPEVRTFEEYTRMPDKEKPLYVRMEKEKVMLYDV